MLCYHSGFRVAGLGIPGGSDEGVHGRQRCKEQVGEFRRVWVLDGGDEFGAMRAEGQLFLSVAILKEAAVAVGEIK